MIKAKHACNQPGWKCRLAQSSVYAQNNSYEPSFIFEVFLATGKLHTTPIALLAKLNRNKRVDKGLVVKAGKDRFDKPLTVFEGDRFYSKVSGQDTDED